MTATIILFPGTRSRPQDPGLQSGSLAYPGRGAPSLAPNTIINAPGSC